MSTLRVSNIEAKANASSPTVDEKVKITDSQGRVLMQVDGKTSGITTVGINTTGNTFTVNANNGITFSGIVTATGGFSGNITGNVIGNVTGNLSGSVNLTTGITTVAAGSTSAPSITPTGDSNTGIFFPSADTIAFAEGGVEAARFDSSGRFGLGTNAPGAKLHSIGGTTSGGVDTAAIFTGGVINTIGSGARIVLSGVPGFETIRGTYIEGVFDTATNAHSLRFGTNASTSEPTERLRIDNGGRLITGNSGFTTTSAYGSTTQYLNLHIIGGAGTNNGGGIFIARNTPSTNAANQDLGNIYWGTNDGAPFARIGAWADGTPTGSSYPGYLSFQTTASGATSPTERMRISANGNVNIGGVDSGAYRLYVLASTSDTSAYVTVMRNSGGSDLFYIRNDGVWGTGGQSGAPYNNTTAVAANMHVNSGGNLYRSTSSARFKTDIETLEDYYADAVLNCRPVWYRSIAPGDTLHSDWGYWGFIAEEVAEVDPRLVFWKTHETQKDEEGNDIQVELDEPLAESVQYDRFVPHLLNLVKRQQQAIKTLEEQNASILARLDALENS